MIGGTSRSTVVVTAEEGGAWTVDPNGVALSSLTITGWSFSYNGNIYFLNSDGEIMKMGSNGWSLVKTIQDEPKRVALVVTPDQLFPGEG